MLKLQKIISVDYGVMNRLIGFTAQLLLKLSNTQVVQYCLDIGFHQKKSDISMTIEKSHTHTHLTA